MEQSIEADGGGVGNIGDVEFVNGETKVDNLTFLSLVVHNFKGESEKANAKSKMRAGEDWLVMDKREVVDVEIQYNIVEDGHRGNSDRDSRAMVITIDMEQAIENDIMYNRDNVAILNRWKNTKHIDDSDDENEKFYKLLGFVCNFGKEQERKIVFRNAYIYAYESHTNSNSSFAKIVIKQKEDLRSGISISPVNTEYDINDHFADATNGVDGASVLAEDNDETNVSAMNYSNALMEHFKNNEGCVLNPYNNYQTIGYGLDYKTHNDININWTMEKIVA